MLLCTRNCFLLSRKEAPYYSATHRVPTRPAAATATLPARFCTAAPVDIAAGLVVAVKDALAPLVGVAAAVVFKVAGTDMPLVGVRIV